MLDLLIFVPACFALNLSFGPSNLLALTHAAEKGVVFAVAAGFGRLLVFIPMIAISALGLGILLTASSLVFTAAKIAGACYLIWLGWKLWQSSAPPKTGGLPRTSMRLSQAFRREGLVAIGNPKAILIFAAFFPQFVVVDAYFESYALLSLIFIALEAIAISLYATAGALAARTAALKLHWFQRASGVGMMLFGGLLLFARRPT